MTIERTTILRRQRRQRGGGGGYAPGARRGGAAYHADPGQDRNRDQRERGEPDHRSLAIGHDDEGRHQRPERLAEIAADLKQGLRTAVPAARSGARHARRFGMKDRRPDPDQRDRPEQQGIAAAERQQREPAQGEQHRDGQRIGLRPPVRIEADDRLQQGGRQLERERDEPGLEEREAELVAKHRIERRRQRLHHVVEHVRDADRDEDAQRRAFGDAAAHGGGGWRFKRHAGRLLCKDAQGIPGADGRARTEQAPGNEASSLNVLIKCAPRFRE